MGTRSCQVLVVNVTERKGTFDGMESRLEEITKGNLWNYTHTKKKKKKRFEKIGKKGKGKKGENQ